MIGAGLRLARLAIRLAATTPARPARPARSASRTGRPPGFRAGTGATRGRMASCRAPLGTWAPAVRSRSPRGPARTRPRSVPTAARLTPAPAAAARGLDTRTGGLAARVTRRGRAGASSPDDGVVEGTRRGITLCGSAAGRVAARGAGGAERGVRRAFGTCDEAPFARGFGSAAGVTDSAGAAAPGVGSATTAGTPGRGSGEPALGPAEAVTGAGAGAGKGTGTGEAGCAGAGAGTGTGVASAGCGAGEGNGVAGGGRSESGST